LATYFLNLKNFGRAAGSNAVSLAAYRAGERIHDERGGRTYDHSARRDVLHKEIFVPEQFAANDMRWAKDRANLWNLAEAAESRPDARVAREYLVALPFELSPEKRVDLARDFSKELVERYRFAVDLAVHKPRDFPGSDPRNFHAHLLATTREVTTAGLSAKTALEWSDTRRREAGLGRAVGELVHVRQRWAETANEFLRQAHLEARIDHRTLKAQGIDREPKLWIPRIAFEMERHGYRSAQAERIREEYQARLDARHQAAAQLEHTARQPKTMEQTQQESRSAWMRYRDAHPQPNTEELSRQSAAAWRRYRDAHLDSSRTEQPSKEPPGLDTSRSRDDDYSL
jgi:ATP-dependent exoDNAse (exonuclease V) alpha subunit